MSKHAAGGLTQEMETVLGKWCATAALNCGGSCGGGKGKPQKVTICVTSIGLFVFKRKSSKKGNPTLFVLSYMDFNAVSQNDEEDLEFISFAGDVLKTITVEGVSQFITALQENYARMMNGSGITLEFKGRLHPREGPKEIAPNNVTLKYYSMCAKHDVDVDQDLCRIFREYEKSERRMICFDLERETVSPYVVCPPLYYEKSLRLVVFEKFAPRMLGMILADLFGTNHYITSCTLSSYGTEMIFEPILGDGLEKWSVVSWTLYNLTTTEFSWSVLWSTFRIMSGAIQQLTIQKVALTEQKVLDLQVNLRNGSAFRSLESLTLDEITMDAASVCHLLYHLVASLPRGLPLLSKVVCKRWSQGVSLKPEGQRMHLIFSEAVRHLSLYKALLTNATTPISFPSQLSALDFTLCAFSIDSLLHILREIGEKIKRPFALGLDAVCMKKTERSVFYAKLGGLPALSQVVELDWSRTAVPVDQFDDWARVFLTPSLKFLTLSRIFKEATKQVLYRVIDFLATNNQLWGLCLGGPVNREKEAELDLADNLAEVYSRIAKLQSLVHLDVSRHSFTKTLTVWTQDFLKKMPNLRELVCDNSGLATVEDLQSFYSAVLSQKLTSVKLPIGDMLRLFGPRCEAQQSPEYVKFKAMFDNFPDPVESSVRKMFYATGKDLSQLRDYAKTFPFTFFSYRPGDEICFSRIPEERFEARSIINLDAGPTPPASYADLQVSCLKSPYEMPRGHPARRFELPARFATAEPQASTEEPSTSEVSKGRRKRHSEKKKRRHRSSKKMSVPIIETPVEKCPVSPSVIRNICTIRALFDLYGDEPCSFQTNVTVPELPQFITEEGTRWIEEKMVDVARDEPTEGPIEESTEQFPRLSARATISMEQIDMREEMTDTVELENETEELPPEEELPTSQGDTEDFLELPDYRDDFFDFLPQQPMIPIEQPQREETARFPMLPALPETVNTKRIFDVVLGTEPEIQWGSGYSGELLVRIKEVKQQDALKKIEMAGEILERRTPWRNMTIATLPREPDTADNRLNVTPEMNKQLENYRNLYARVTTLPRELRRSTVAQRRTAELNLDDIEGPTLSRDLSQQGSDDEGLARERHSTLPRNGGWLWSSAGNERKQQEREGVTAQTSLRSLFESGRRPGSLAPPPLPLMDILDPFDIPDSVPVPTNTPGQIPPAPERMCVCAGQLNRTAFPSLS